LTDNHGFTIVEATPTADLGFLRVEQRTVRTPAGGLIERVVILHPGAVAVVALCGDDIVLISQYRAPVDYVIVEIPAGKLDKVGEDKPSAARRELAEETGYVADELIHLIDLLTGVGFTDEVISIYLAPSVEPGEPSPEGAEETAAVVHTMPFAEAHEAVVRGTITDAKTVAGILLAGQLHGTA